MTANDRNFSLEIMDLIESHHEGSYWDFKQEWYHDKADMLHDIICMANNLEDHDAYIIIGVCDDFSICGIENDSNRKTTQNIVNFLQDKKFAGGFRPEVDIVHILIDEHTLDIIRVKNSNHVPYYLEERYQGVNPYHIYTRVQDSNTPKNKSADLIHIEMLWGKRFHLLDAPLQKVQYLLSQKHNWMDSVSTESSISKYYKYAPEYIIKTSSIEGDATETYTLTQMDKHSSFHQISLYYHQTRLFTSLGVLLDGGRFMTVTPQLGSLDINSKHIYYYCLCKDSIKFAIYKFFLHDEDSRDYLANLNFTNEILFFEDEEEKQNFEIYVHRHTQEYENYVHNIKSDKQRRLIPQMQEEYDNRLALKQVQEDFKNYNSMNKYAVAENGLKSLEI